MTRLISCDRVRLITFLRFACLFTVAAAWRHKVQEASLLAVSMEGSKFSTMHGSKNSNLSLSSMKESSEAVDISNSPPALSTSQVPPDTSRVAVDDLDRYIEDANLADFSPSYREILQEEFPMVYDCSLQDYKDDGTHSGTFMITVVGKKRKRYLVHPRMTAEDLKECIAIRQKEGLQPTDFYLMCDTKPLGAAVPMSTILDGGGDPLCEVEVKEVVLGGMAYGNKVEWQDYDFVALLKIKDTSGHISTCTGSLVQGSNPSKWYVLSAAHCTKAYHNKPSKEPSRYSVIVHSKLSEHQDPIINDVVSVPNLKLHAIVVRAESSYLEVSPLRAFEQRKNMFSRALKSMSKKKLIKVRYESVTLLHEKEVSVVKVDIHPYYRSEKPHFDVAILTLGKVLLASNRPHSYQTIATQHPLCIDFKPMTQGEHLHLAAFGLHEKAKGLKFVVDNEDSGLRAGMFEALPDFTALFPYGDYARTSFTVGLEKARSMPGDSGGPYWQEVSTLSSTAIHLRGTHGGALPVEDFCVVKDNTQIVGRMSNDTEVPNGEPGHYTKFGTFLVWRGYKEIVMKRAGVTCWPKLSYFSPLSHSESFIRKVIGDGVACA